MDKVSQIRQLAAEIRRLSDEALAEGTNPFDILDAALGAWGMDLSSLGPTQRLIISRQFGQMTRVETERFSEGVTEHAG